MTSSNGDMFRVTVPLWGEPTGTGGFPSQRPVTRSFDVFVDLRLDKRLSNHSRRRIVLRHYDVTVMIHTSFMLSTYIVHLYQVGPQTAVIVVHQIHALPTGQLDGTDTGTVIAVTTAENKITFSFKYWGFVRKYQIVFVFSTIKHWDGVVKMMSMWLLIHASGACCEVLVSPIDVPYLHVLPYVIWYCIGPPYNKRRII